MQNGFEQLQQIGIERIVEKTHISHRNVEALLQRRFKNIPRVQFMGFVSILEREFACNLDDLRADYQAYFDANCSVEEQVELFINADKAPPSKFPAIFAVVLILVGAIVLLNYFSKSDSVQQPEINDSALIEATAALKSAAPEVLEPEANASEPQMNSSLSVAVPSDILEEANLAEAPKPISIVPRAKVWMGIIELPERKRTQRLSETPYDLNASSSYLIVLGHGFVDIVEGNETRRLNDKNRLFFIYENYELRQLGRKEFEPLNQGRVW